MEAVKVPQHLELGDVVAWGLGPVDLLCVFAGATVSWWLYLALPDATPLRLLVALPPAVIGAGLGIVRLGEVSLREWLMVAIAFALRPRILVVGGRW
jgi:hypothetical protein